MTTYSPTAPHVRDTIETDTGRAPIVALIVFLAALPLEWMTVTGAGAALIKPFHIASIAFTLVCIARWRPSRVITPMWQRHVAVFGGYAVLLGVAVAASLVHVAPLLTPTLIVRQIFYITMSLVLAAYVARMVGRPDQRWLALSGVVSTAVLLLAFVVELARQRVNPLSVIVSAISQVDPNLISYQLLRTTFRTETDLADAAASLRHKVFIALLIAVLLGLACSAIIARRQRLVRGVIVGGSAVGFVLTLVSLSRSAIVCMAVPGALYLLRLVVRGRARPVEAATLMVAVTATLAAVVSPIGELLLVRFTATGSYTARLTAAGPSFLEDFAAAALIGTSRSAAEAPPHNLILHSWLAGGIVAAAAALVVLLALAWLWLREVRRYLAGGQGWVIPVVQLWVLGIGAIPLVRSFTAGGQFHMVEFTAMALFLGITFANERAARSGGQQPRPDRAPSAT